MNKQLTVQNISIVYLPISWFVKFAQHFTTVRPCGESENLCLSAEPLIFAVGSLLQNLKVAQEFFLLQQLYALFLLEDRGEVSVAMENLLIYLLSWKLLLLCV